MPTTTCDHLNHPESWPGDSGCLTDLSYYDVPDPSVAITAALRAHGLFTAWETK